jgi:hypothetical protein
MLQSGNINILSRPQVKNPQGGISTVDSTSFNIGGREVLVPRVVGNRVVSPREALLNYLETGKHLGVFKNVAAANSYAELLHRQQALYYGS